MEQKIPGWLETEDLDFRYEVQGIVYIDKAL